MEIPNQLVEEIKTYLVKRPLGETYGLFTRLTLAEAEYKKKADAPNLLAALPEGVR